MKRIFAVILAAATLSEAVNCRAEAPTGGAEEGIFGELPVIFTVSKFAQKSSDAPGVVSIFTKEDLRRFGAGTLKDALMRIPGLSDVTSYFPDRDILAVRGLQVKESGAHTLLLINGRPVREVLQGGVVDEILESFPLNAVERIEVVKGPGSVLYGSGAFLGVINVITEKIDGNGASVGALAGSAGAADVYGKAQAKSGDFSIMAAGKYHEKSDWESRLSYRKSGTTYLSRDTRIEDQGPGAYAEINYKNLKVMTSYDRWDSTYDFGDLNAITTNLSGVGTFITEKKFVDAGYSQKLTDYWTSDLNVTFTHYFLSGIRTPASYPDVERRSYNLMAEWSNTIRPNEKTDFVIGGTYGRDDGLVRTSTASSPSTFPAGSALIQNTLDAARYTNSLYLQADYAPANWMKAIGGLQYNKVQLVDSDVVPRAGLIFFPSQAWSVKTLYSEAFRAPSLTESFNNHPTLKGGKNVLSEKVATYDLSVSRFGPKSQVTATCSYSKIRDLIDAPVGTTPRVYRNVGSLISRSYELEGKFYPMDQRLVLEFSALHQETVNYRNQTDISPLPNFSAKGGVSYDAHGWTASLFERYEGPLDNKYSTVVNPTPAGSYSVLDFNFRADINQLAGWSGKRTLTFLLRADNLLDKEIWLSSIGRGSGIASEPRSNGRTVYSGIEVSF